MSNATSDATPVRPRADGRAARLRRLVEAVTAVQEYVDAGFTQISIVPVGAEVAPSL